MAKKFSSRTLIKLRDVFQGSEWLLLRWYQWNSYSDGQLIYSICDPNQAMKNQTGPFFLFLSWEDFLLYLLASVWPVAVRITQSSPLCLLGSYLCLSYVQPDTASSVLIKVSLEEMCNLQLIVEVGHKELKICAAGHLLGKSLLGVEWHG